MNYVFDSINLYHVDEPQPKIKYSQTGIVVSNFSAAEQ